MCVGTIVLVCRSVEEPAINIEFPILATRVVSKSQVETDGRAGALPRPAFTSRRMRNARLFRTLQSIRWETQPTRARYDDGCSSVHGNSAQRDYWRVA